jgi:hypothetical protein
MCALAFICSECKKPCNEAWEPDECDRMGLCSDCCSATLLDPDTGNEVKSL